MFWLFVVDTVQVQQLFISAHYDSKVERVLFAVEITLLESTFTLQALKI